MKPQERYNTLLATKLIEELEKRNMEGFYCETKAEALTKVLEMIPKDSLVSCGGSATLDEIGLRNALKNEGYNFLDPRDASGPAAMEAASHQALVADYFLMSANAISAAGELVNADGIGNRVAALIYGPKNVIVIAGMNKVAPTLDAAIQRIKSYAGALTCLTYQKGISSYDELVSAAENAVSHLVITRNSVFKGRIKVILVGESLGY